MHAPEYFTTSHSQGNGLPEKTDWREWGVDVSHYKKAVAVKESGSFWWEKRAKILSFNVVLPTNLCSVYPMMFLHFKMSKVWNYPKIKLKYLKLFIWRTHYCFAHSCGVMTNSAITSTDSMPFINLLSKKRWHFIQIKFHQCSQATEVSAYP